MPVLLFQPPWELTRRALFWLWHTAQTRGSSIPKSNTNGWNYQQFSIHEREIRSEVLTRVRSIR